MAPDDILKLLSESYLSTVAAQDSDGISILFAFATQVIGTMAMPELMQDDDRVASKTFSDRAADRGSYLVEFGKAGGFDQPAKLMQNIGRFGCFRLEFEGDFVSPSSTSQEPWRLSRSTCRPRSRTRRPIGSRRRTSVLTGCAAPRSE